MAGHRFGPTPFGPCLDCGCSWAWAQSYQVCNPLRGTAPPLPAPLSGGLTTSHRFATPPPGANYGSCLGCGCTFAWAQANNTTCVPPAPASPPPSGPPHMFAFGTDHCLICGLKATYMPSMGTWIFIGSAVCAGPTTTAVLPKQLLLPFDWDPPELGPEPRTPAMARRCPDCDREWCEVLDAYAGTDPTMGERCEPCRRRWERGTMP